MSRVENVDLRVALQLFCFFEKLIVIGVVFASLGWTLRNILDLLTWNITM